MTGISCKYFLCSLYANAITLSTDARSLLRIGFSIRAVDNKVRSGVAGFESATVVWDRRSPLFSIFYRSDRTHPRRWYVPATTMSGPQVHASTFVDPLASLSTRRHRNNRQTCCSLCNRQLAHKYPPRRRQQQRQSICTTENEKPSTAVPPASRIVLRLCSINPGAAVARALHDPALILILCIP